MIIIREAKRPVKSIRKGKVVTRNVETNKRPKRMTPKQRIALKKARRKAHRGPAKIKRKRSMTKRKKISQGAQKRSAGFASKRRSLGRSYENFYLAKESKIFVYGQSILTIKEGSIIDIYEDEDTEKIYLDAYDLNGNLYISELEITENDAFNQINDNEFLSLVEDFELENDDEEVE